jgi:hypothetical protein
MSKAEFKDETKCPFCKAFYPTREIDAHKASCSLRPQ